MKTNTYTFTRFVGILGILLVWVARTDCQHLYDLFVPDLPQSISGRGDMIGLVNNQIGYKATLQPELIYYYFEYLELRFGQKITDPSLNGYAFVRGIEGDFALGYADWREKEIENIDRSNWVNIVKSDAADGLDRMTRFSKESSSTQPPPFTIDENKRDYFVYKFLVSDTAMRYSSDQDYGAILNEKKRSVLSTYVLANAQPSEMSSEERDELVQEIRGNWYLFPDSSVTPTDRRSLTELLCTISHLNLLDKKIEELGASATYARNHTITGFSTSVHSTAGQYMPFDQIVDVQFDPYQSNQIGVSANYRFRLSEYPEPLAFIEAEIFVLRQFGTSVQNAPGVEQTEWGSNAFYDFYTLMDFKTNEIEYTNFNTYGLSVKTPVTWFGSSLSIDLGISVSYNSIEIMHRYQYVWRTLFIQHGTGNQGSLGGYSPMYEEQLSETWTVVSPQISMKFFPWPFITIKADAYLDFYSFSAGFNF